MTEKQELTVYETDEKQLKVKAVVLRTGERSPTSGVIYPREVVEKSIEDFKTGKDDGKHLALGYLSEGVAGDKNPGLEGVTHVLEDVELTDEGVVATLRILETTPRGKLLAGMLRSGCAFNSSIRGYGSVDEDKTVTDYELEGIDLSIKSKDMALVKMSDKLTEQEVEALKLRGRGHKRVLRIER